MDFLIDIFFHDAVCLCLIDLPGASFPDEEEQTKDPSNIFCFHVNKFFECFLDFVYRQVTFNGGVPFVLELVFPAK